VPPDGDEALTYKLPVLCPQEGWVGVALKLTGLAGTGLAIIDAVVDTTASPQLFDALTKTV
jgi:hypothetical protein